MNLNKIDLQAVLKLLDEMKKHVDYGFNMPMTNRVDKIEKLIKEVIHRCV